MLTPYYSMCDRIDEGSNLYHKIHNLIQIIDQNFLRGKMIYWAPSYPNSKDPWVDLDLDIDLASMRWNEV